MRPNQELHNDAFARIKGYSSQLSCGDEQVEVLKGISLDIYAGEMVAIVGASGSGKSTLMNILGCLDKATSGTYRVAGQDVATLDADALAQLRREHFGFIFQRYHLLSHLTAEQNVEVPAVYAGLERKQRLASCPGVAATAGAGKTVQSIIRHSFRVVSNSASASRGH
ncbi:macrolide export ATP-binding/permease protein [Escherichia coli]|uniref:Macrolide export ATP-binding/permease protein n=1 Tax=Escherichia coli TaxID=562 RepID=A0A2X1MZY4_ECOLX|nr:macrolide export ATP-binding/permease protein [Escherichia coli]